MRFEIQVIGNPAAGIQEVWVLYTAGVGAVGRALDAAGSRPGSR